MRYTVTNEHPEKRLLDHGASALTDAELLSVLLSCDRQGARHCSVSEANTFIDANVYLSALIHQNMARYREHFGESVGTSRYATFQAGMELYRRLLLKTMPERMTMSSPSEVHQYLATHMSGLEYEVFGTLFLDNRHGVIAYEALFRGTIDSTGVYPREVVKTALRYNSAALVLCHNHPSGIAQPSDADVRLTRRLVDALALVDIRVLDHLIFGDGEHVSLAERGLM